MTLNAIEHQLGGAMTNKYLMRIIPILLVLSAKSILTVYRGDSIVQINPSAKFDVYLEGGPPIQDEYFWDNHKATSCFSLDSICHGNDKWFYRRSDEPTSRQPTITYVQHNVTSSHGYLRVEPRIYFNVSAASINNADSDFCPMDPTPIHMIVQSAYNDMMGEFYSRSLVALNQLLHDNPIHDGNYYNDLQMYLHVIEKKKETPLEGHRLFLGGLPNNNKFDSFLSLIENDTCQCFKKLVFCGYDMESATEYQPPNKMSSIEYDNLPKEYRSKDAKVFKPVGYIRSPKTLCTRVTAGKFDLKKHSCFGYRDLRRDIYETYALKDTSLSQKIAEYRRQILQQKGIIDSNITLDEVNTWTYVGLTMRKKRRIWLNMDDSISLCDVKFRKQKVVCFPVDVEAATSPEEQLLMHRSLNALIGVHGAQLTQGVLLPPHSKILELLPWIPPYLIGNWVQWTNRPTPLGVIYHETNLNHFGYKLDRNSVPLCFNVTDSDADALRECFMSKNGHLKKFQWATRSFTVEPDVIRSFISLFVLDNKSICEDMQTNAQAHGFVLYNAFCRSDRVNSQFQVQHYFTE